MASDARVKEILADELTQRVGPRFADAGANWPKRDMGFFFPENENTVDLCVLATLDRALDEDGTTVTKKVRKDVAFLIGTTTKAKDGIRIIALTTLQPSPK
jgi:hypothetical protein